MSKKNSRMENALAYHSIPLVAPSLLSADFSNIQESIRLIESSGADWVHLDVMDGVFVPNITFGPKFIADAKKHSNKIFDVHLMITQPERHIQEFISAGSDYLTFHIESCIHSHRLVQQIRDADVKPGISIVPSTPVSTIVELLPYIDQVLVMTVNPGFGGQSLIQSCVKKIEQLKMLREDLGLSFLIAVDGGVNEKTADDIIHAGADVLIAGSAFFSAPDTAAFVAALKHGKLGR
jgi:ribulose-phosphate 3-epimerase